eukprot:CAMPEP_0116141992 /NCGR_PEP_ID=MMETSP0329-20121206/14670_1 /TAXON_ID=697910 /ORGANISM="Pseudo-nitzschia arenysensis, Strain B593" /LENGTH=83 /DNA_ID=CAMNT_0003637197 /DNA_START=260 /DNA_END=511 /DNA_ORIENTATION=-
MQNGSSTDNNNDTKDDDIKDDDSDLSSTMARLGGTMLDDYLFMCPCSPSLRHRVDLVVLGDRSTDHSLSFKEEIDRKRWCPTG